MELRDYQLDVKKKIKEAWDQGFQNILAQLATGAGKTVLMANIIKEHEGLTLAIAHRCEIVSQISLTLARHSIYHNIIAQKSTIREIIALHMRELGRSFYTVYGNVHVAGIDTLIRMTEVPQDISLIIQDEAHHVLKTNKWGKAVDMFPNARGLYLTATPVRADGRGLGRHHDGVIDRMVIGTSMRELIERGYLTKYRIFAPPSDIDMSNVTISATGDYSPPKLRTAVHKSHITGDVVSHYLRIAPGKLGVTFVVDIASATEIAEEYRKQGVKAEVISSKTPVLLRAELMRKFREREITQLVNVDILGEGVDVPAIEVVSMARPTASYCLFSQSFGRALRPMPGKETAIIIDHVGNTIRHGLPDAYREWSLDRRNKRSKRIGEIPLRCCLNPQCLAVYERVHKFCPICGHYPSPSSRSAPELVDGDLTELNEAILKKLRGEIEKIDSPPFIYDYLHPVIQGSLIKNHKEYQATQARLRSAIACWAGYHKEKGMDDSTIYRIFYFTFGVDIMTAQTLKRKEAALLDGRIMANIDELDRNRIAYYA